MNTKFNKKQNEAKILDLLYAQRILYNRADIYNLLIFICTIVVSIINLTDFLDKIVNAIVLFSINYIVIVFLNNKANLNINKGAKFKEYIDSYIMNDDYKLDISDEENTLISQLTLRINKNYINQITTTGEGKNRGVKNWYLFDKKASDQENIKSMFNQNYFFDYNLSMNYLFIIALPIIFIFFGLITFNNGIYLDITKLLFVIPTLHYCFEKIMFFYKLKCIHEKIKLALIYDDYNKALYLITERRKINFCPPDFLHKLQSNKLHNIIKNKK